MATASRRWPVSRTYFHNTTREDRETEIVVEIEVTSWGSPATWDDPAEGMECEIIDAWLASDGNKADAPRITLTDDEDQRICTEFAESDATEDDGDMAF